MNTTTAEIKNLNDRLYRAARKAGREFEQALHYAHVEITSWGSSTPYVTWNHDHEPSDDIEPLDFRAIDRAKAWLKAALAAASPWQITINFSEAGEQWHGRSFATFTEIDSALAEIACKAPKGGAYDKTDVTVEHLPSGEEYSTRIDVQSSLEQAPPRLRQHMLDYCNSMLTGRGAKFMAEHQPEKLAEAQQNARLWIGLLS